MADETEEEKNDKSPGIGMRMSISMISKKFSKVNNISTSTLDKWIKEKEKDVVLLDCRPEEEYAVSHIPDAIRVDYNGNPQDILPKIPEKESSKRALVCYCSAGYRSSLVVDKLQEYFKQNGAEVGQPFEMYNLEGSLFKWANEGRDMVNVNNEKTPYAHPFNAVYGKLLESRLRKSHM